MRMKETDFKRLAALKEAVVRSYYDRDQIEQKMRLSETPVGQMGSVHLNAATITSQS
jgi:hypothetical protein